MASEPDPDRLRALEERIAGLKGKPKVERHAAAKGFSQGELAWRMVIELASGIVVGSGIGYGLDYWLGTLPVFLVIFTVLGFVAGVKTVIGTAREMSEKQLAQAEKDTQAASRAAADEGN